ncbi:homocysteine methyltransferase [Plesiocystis pacifica SIR-1]|uniref:Homocysteine methyltransferase n=1 Tax=Plesiocystis pacifica SIR-1 TaxID=391625 RepID=A6G853_9BACT|nr:homocysteine S-methyltransferase [Plesiocystis pacifica]EDM77894.1 homocysteine methyltransferase [Plesiocystis pacifica SIR-1]
MSAEADGMDALDRLLAREPFAVLDGGLATSLEACGCDLDDPLWSARLLLDDPEALRTVHRRWRDAGADILATASYQASLPGLRAKGLSEARAKALLRESVTLTRAAADEANAPRPLIAASVGSYGAYLADGSEYRGGYGLSVEALADFHRPRLLELAAAGPDLIAFETFPDAVELAALAELLTELLTELGDTLPRAWISASLSPPGPDRSVRLADGTPLTKALAPLTDHPKVAALGVNCVGPREVAPALEVLAACTDRPLVAYPNSGERWIDRGWSGAALEPNKFAALAERWFELGARLIGGCCRTNYAHIQALVKLRERIAAAT